MLGYALVIIVVVLAVFLGCLVHAGFFYSLRIRTSIPSSIPSRVAYKVYRGAYKNAGAGFNDITQLAPSVKKFGLYYDDPAKVSCTSTTPLILLHEFLIFKRRRARIPVLCIYSGTLCKDTPEMRTSPLIRTLCMVPVT